MGTTHDIIDDIRRQIAAHDDSLKEARRRRDLVLSAASQFPGASRSYESGSVAAGLVNQPVNDADGGVVLDRRCFPSLGPDGTQEDPPDEIVEEIRTWIGDTLRDEVGDDYPNLSS